MTDEQKMKTEVARVRDLLSEAIKDIEIDEGDLRFFSASLLTAAIQLHGELEGTAALERAIANLAQREMVRSGQAGRS